MAENEERQRPKKKFGAIEVKINPTDDNTSSELLMANNVGTYMTGIYYEKKAAHYNV
jgi:hypothetical protein